VYTQVPKPCPHWLDSVRVCYGQNVLTHQKSLLDALAYGITHPKSYKTEFLSGQLLLTDN